MDKGSGSTLNGSRLLSKSGAGNRALQNSRAAASESWLVRIVSLAEHRLQIKPDTLVQKPRDRAMKHGKSPKAGGFTDKL